MAFNKKTNINPNFTKISISLASPEEIIASSYGEVLKPETINYRTYKPERDGLFCEKIFGPVRDYECNCGKYKRIRYRGNVCDRCGVEVTEKKVRRDRCGHIELVVPVAHIWYFKSNPNKISYLLGIPSKKLESVIYYEKYYILQPGILKDEEAGIVEGALVDEIQYMDLMDKLDEMHAQINRDRAEAGEEPLLENRYMDDSDENKFICKMGAEAIYDLLVKLDLDQVSNELRATAHAPKGSQQAKTEALKRLSVVEAFRSSAHRNKPEWMILKILPVIPPELRPLVPLDGGRFATSDLNDLYRRVIIRNNRLKRLLEINAPEVILRNEKRMLQEAVDSLIDNSRKSNAMKTESNRPLKSLTDSLKGKQGRFRQNLLGKRVDYSARSVIVVGPELEMHECGLPKDMAAELYKPFIIRKLIERGIVKTVKSAKKFIDRKEPVVFDILENVMKGHPVLLNRAPTLHRLGIQAFQPKMIEGKAIQLHPLACTAFNADFDGDQMAVHLPLSNEAILEAQMLMLASHNILNPANGAPITVPSQDMVLGLYYITKLRKGEKGEGLTFYSPEEATIAYNEGKVGIHAPINVRINDVNEKGEYEQGATTIVKQTSVGRIIVNNFYPTECGYINDILSKKNLRNIIGKVIERCGVARTARFLDDIKNLGYYMAFRGGLSFNLADVIIPDEKATIVAEGNEKVDEIRYNYDMGFITANERYNQTIGIWSRVNEELTAVVMKRLKEDNDGFNSVYMMLDSGARGSKDQIRQLTGMRGLMAKPQKAGAQGGQVIENPILANFKEGLSVLEYFISTHGARKGLADTALKTADAGYLTRRLVDVSHDVIITEEDCGTLRGLVATEIKKGETVVATLGERILGRVSLHDIIDPHTAQIIVASGDMINEEHVRLIEKAGIESVEIRSVLTCEARKGVCAKCYGRNLATGLLVNKGEAVGVIAAQSIGEPGTQLTLRTFHVGGTANVNVEKDFKAKRAGRIEIDDLRTVFSEDDNCDIVVSRFAEARLVDAQTGIVMATQNIQYGSKLYKKSGDLVEKDEIVWEWDPYNKVTVSDVSGYAVFDGMEAGVTYESHISEQTGFEDIVIIESRNRSLVPSVSIVDKEGNVLRTYNLPVKGQLAIKMPSKKSEKIEVKAGTILVKSPRTAAGAGDITGGLPRVTELFEARNPSNPAFVAEIDGEIKFGAVKRSNREVIIESKSGEKKVYNIPQNRELTVQEQDVVRAGAPLSEGAITPADILAIKGPTAVQEYIVNEVQDVYRLQGVKINDKHFEIIVRQMMRKVKIEDAGDTRFLQDQVVDKFEFMEENDRIYGLKVVVDAGDSTNFQAGQIVTAKKLRDENSSLKRRDLRLVEARDAMPATSSQMLQGITRAALQTNSFISAASFQETPKVLNEAAIYAKTDTLDGMKENVIVGHKIPAGTGLREYEQLVVFTRDEYEAKIKEEESETLLSEE